MFATEWRRSSPRRACGAAGEAAVDARGHPFAQHANAPRAGDGGGRPARDRSGLPSWNGTRAIIVLVLFYVVSKKPGQA